MAERAYKIGERNPALMEDPETERRRAIYWRWVRRWAETPGGKY